MRCKCDIKMGYDLGLILMTVGILKSFENPFFIFIVLVGAILACIEGHKFYDG